MQLFMCKLCIAIDSYKICILLLSVFLSCSYGNVNTEVEECLNQSYWNILYITDALL